MTDKKNNGGRARESARRFIDERSKGTRRLTVWSVFGLFVVFCGWKQLRRFLQSHPLKKLTPLSVAIGATVVFGLIFGWWMVTDHASTPTETLLQRLNRFEQEWGGLLYVYALFVPFLMWLLDKIDPKHIDAKLRRAQKERVKILTGFAPSPETETLFSDRSIYDAMLGTLGRLETRHGTKDLGGGTRFRLCLLLCSPAVDYPGNPKQPWGEEFITMLRGFINHPNIHFDICHLPVEPLLGYDPMEDFLAVLADYIVDAKIENVRDVHQMLSTRTKTIDKEIEGFEASHPDRFTVRPAMLDIPFQMVLVLGDEMKEVVISFAGREILERGDSDPKGFFSSDPYVVETFHRIYEDYVAQGGRARLVPPLTQGVIDKHAQRKSHRLLNYCHTVQTIEVGEGCFSPGIANSTKFTCWAIGKLLSKDDISILDIGSGTGVLALVAKATLERLGVASPRIVATEFADAAYETLKKNCTEGIETRKWKLSTNPVPEGEPAACFVDMENDGQPVQDADVGRFKVIIADLPFVDSKGGEPTDQRFFDPYHRSHASLFAAVASNGWLEDGGKLITAFSSLGGPYDVVLFERMIAESGLRIAQRLDFHESNYLWIVHVIMRKDDFDPESFWWEELNARQFAVGMS